MQHEYALTPKELYFLGELFQARYIDFFYISALGDVQKRLHAHRREAFRHLAEQGLLREDFDGGHHVSAQLRQTMRPVFFGPTETTLQLYCPGQCEVRAWRLHSLDGQITRVIMEDDRLYVREMDDAGLRRLAALVAPQTEPVTPARPLDRVYVRRIVTVRQATVGTPAHEEVWLEQDGIIYRDGHEPVLTSMTAEEFKEHIYGILRGEHVWQTAKD